EEKGSLRRGKWILRKAFEGFLPGEVIWQDKRPLEYGSGMTGLRAIIESMISDKEFEEKKRRYPVKFITKDHLYYYEIYLKEVGDIPKPGEGQKSCTGCGAGIGVSSFHCKVCGNLQEGVT
ncbi:MAG: asparagine synthase, partial [Candidatus Omnitrophica bacterium]|nr:asparagine synthase [Candidatus Omnitrophota bacterium]